MKIYLAPMEGITTFIYRNIYNRYYGNIDKYYTPFVTAKKLKGRELKEVMPEHNEGLNVVPQILTNNAETFIEITKQLENMGYTEVNFNLGCPSGTVVNKHRGAGFLSVPDDLKYFLDEIFNECNIDISIKTRLGVNNLDDWPEILKIYSEYDIKELIIHARLLSEGYGGYVHTDMFNLAKYILSCPLCYNGDITDEKSFEKIYKECDSPDAIMIGRGAIVNPELSYSLKSFYLNNNTFNTDSDNVNNSNGNIDNIIFENKKGKKSDNQAIFKEFHNELYIAYKEYMSGEVPVLFKMKELWNYWSNSGNFPNNEKLLKKIRKSKNLREYESIMATIFN